MITRPSWMSHTEHLPADSKLIDVADQGADRFEFLEHECNSGRRFVIRAYKTRKARKDAEFIVRGGPVLVCPPHAKRGNHGDQPLELYVVQVTEVSPPAGEKAVDWMLLINEPVLTFEDARRVIGWYERRSLVEELHQAKKMG